ncbi:MAG: hypothetical protein QXQ91_03960, partial [Nanopusillaceae archaeon]
QYKELKDVALPNSLRHSIVVSVNTIERIDKESGGFSHAWGFYRGLEYNRKKELKGLPLQPTSDRSPTREYNR